MLSSFKPYISLIRVKQWIKNLFIFAPLLFAERFLDVASILLALKAFILFSFVSSIIYIFNDILDLDSDRRHPVKCKVRPLASGLISVRQALKVGLLLIVCALYLIRGFPLTVILGVVSYVVINLLYSIKIKHFPIIDIFCIASGFLIRIYIGATAINVPISSWMLITVLSLSIFLASIKRLQELKVIQHNARGVLVNYSEKLLEQYILTAQICSIVFYSLFVISERKRLWVTIPLVIYGFYRYLYLVELKGKGESPTDVILTDLPLIIVLIIWMILCIIVLLKYP